MRHDHKMVTDDVQFYDQEYRESTRITKQIREESVRGTIQAQNLDPNIVRAPGFTIRGNFLRKN